MSEKWLVRLDYGSRDDFVQIVEAPHAAKAIGLVVAEFDTDLTPMVKASAERVSSSQGGGKVVPEPV